MSVIIPAYNAAMTIGEALASLSAQTFVAWEAVVVDDGSTDGTSALIAEACATDARIRGWTQPNGGVSAARNAALKAAVADWILFLDADDWIGTGHLGRLMRAHEEQPDADVIHGGWIRVYPDGRHGPVNTAPPAEDLFPVLSQYCALAMHNCLVRRRLVLEVGGFDTTLVTCEDWDLWLRLARAGAKFRLESGATAYYRQRPQSASCDAARMLDDGLAVIARAHRADRRVPRPAAVHAAGAPKEQEIPVLYGFVTWIAGYGIGRGLDTAAWGERLREAHAPMFEPDEAADILFDAVPTGFGVLVDDWEQTWPALRSRIVALFDALERSSGVPGLAMRALRRLERTILDTVPVERPASIGLFHRITIDAARPIGDIDVPDGADRLVVLVRLGLKTLGTIERPAMGVLPGSVLAADVRRAFGMPATARRDASPAPVSEDTERSARWERIFAQPDPWDYGNEYEQVKYRQTLAMLPENGVRRALELACAEGRFTVQLAPRVGELTAADISATALARARQRCAEAGLTSVRFQEIDLCTGVIPAGYDLIVCSEVLYYLDDAEALRRTAGVLAQALVPGGLLVMAHANLLVDDPYHTGFDWEHPYGAQGIGETFARDPLLAFERETRTPLYRIQAFRRVEPGDARPNPDIDECPLEVTLTPAVGDQVRWRGPGTMPEARGTTDRLPVLMYHSVAEEGPDGLAPYRVSPRRFGEHMAQLRRHGFHAVTPDDLRRRLASRQPFPGRPVLVTFDDGYRDTIRNAWPILRRHGMTATVFIVTDAVGERASWDHRYGPPAELMGWDEIRQLWSEGASIGLHGGTHRPWPALTAPALEAELRQAREAFREQLGIAPTVFAYPYGLQDAAVRHHLADIGLTFGLLAGGGLAALDGDPLMLPRIPVTEDWDVDALLAELCRGADA